MGGPVKGCLKLWSTGCNGSWGVNQGATESGEEGQE
jgi:hypothetical protein